MNRGGRLLLTSVCLVLLAAACGGGEEPVGQTGTTPAADGTTAQPEETGSGEGTAAASGEPIVIGFSVSQSGFNAAVGQEWLDGMEIWREMVNSGTGLYEGREPGLFGRPVEFTFSDDESSPETALRNYERLMAEGADFVFPPYGSGSTGVVAPILEREGYAIIGSAASSETVYRQGLRMMVMPIAPTSKYLAAIPDLIQEQGYSTVSMVTLDNPASLDSAAFLTDAIEGNGGQVLGNELFTIGNEDFTPIWSKLKAQDPDVIILHAFGTDAVTAMRQADELDMSPRMWVGFAGPWRNDVFLEGVGENIAECIIADQHWHPEFDFEGSTEFAEAYIAEHGDPLESGTGSDASAAWGFAGGQLLVAALDEVGEEGIEDQSLIIDYLKNASGLETLVGPFEVDPETGINTTTEPGLFQFQGGERVLIAPESLQEREPALPCEPK